MFQFSASHREEDTDDGSEAECEDEETPGGQQLCEVLPQLVAALTHWTMDCLHASRCAIIICVCLEKILKVPVGNDLCRQVSHFHLYLLLTVLEHL